MYSIMCNDIFSLEPNSTNCNFECNCPQSGCSMILLAYPGFTSIGWKVCDLSVVTPEIATATTGPETTTTPTTTTAITTTRTVTETTTVADDGLCSFEIPPSEINGHKFKAHTFQVNEMPKPVSNNCQIPL